MAWSWQRCHWHIKNNNQKLFAVKFLVYWLLGMLSLALVVITADAGFGISLKASAIEMYGLGAVFILAVLSFVTFFSSFFKTEVAFIRGIIMYPVPAFILSGYTWPTEAMPEILQNVSKALPLSWYANTVRELFLYGHSARLLQCAGMLFSLALVFSALAYFILRRRIRNLA